MKAPSATSLSARHVISLVWQLLRPERSFLGLAAIYGIGISLLSLAVPIAVQVLINTVGYTGLTVPLVVLAVTLFGILLTSGLLNALRVHLIEIFARRIYARMTAEIALKALYAQNPFFQDDGKIALFNRYFDIMLIQKSIPVLFVGGFTVLLQAAVGFLLTSFYHPLFLAFNAVVIALIWTIWLIWGASAVKTSVELSNAKHRTASWLQGLAASNGYFKSEAHIAHALTETDRATDTYISAHRKHFRRHFSQTVSFLILYAAASASLLGLGGWLVIQGQLSLGQLVAAELVLSVAFYGVSQLGTYLNYFYDLCAASEELSLLDEIEQEEPSGSELPSRSDNTLVFDGVKGKARGLTAKLDLTIPGGTQIQATAASHGVQRLFTNLLKRFDEPEGGILTLGGDDITVVDVLALRREVMVLDRPTVPAMSMREYLKLANPAVSSAEMIAVLHCVALDGVIEELEDGLDTQLATTGWPLSINEIMRLKLAAAMLAKPKILVLNQLFDTLSDKHLRSAMARLEREEYRTTVIIFTTRERNLGLNSYLHLGQFEQTMFDDYQSFLTACSNATVDAATSGALEDA